MCSNELCGLGPEVMVCAESCSLLAAQVSQLSPSAHQRAGACREQHGDAMDTYFVSQCSP